MSLIVEDGSGLSTAQSYVSVADADMRLSTNLGFDTWDSCTPTEKEQALRRATAYMEQAYRDRWQGYRQTATQALSWPRNSVVVDEFVVVPSNAIPADIANACADLAFRAAAGDLNADLTRRVVREKVGPIETEYDRYSPQSTRFAAIDMMLAPYLKGSSVSAKLVRG